MDSGRVAADVVELSARGQGVRNFDNVDANGNPPALENTITNAMSASD